MSRYLRFVLLLCCGFTVLQAAEADAAPEAAGPSETPRELARPLPTVSERWSPDPLRGAGAAVQQVGADSYRLGPLPVGGTRRHVDLRLRDHRWHAELEAVDDESPRRLSTQTLFRRLIVGPLGPEELGAAAQRDGVAEHYWLLIKDGRVVVDVHLGEPRHFADELAFDLAFHAIRFGPMSDEQRAAWKQAYWQREHALMREHLIGQPPPVDPSPPADPDAPAARPPAP
ncbi:MAG: hypothetical protein ACOCYV_00885 [Planctomycetota bacterium]